MLNYISILPRVVPLGLPEGHWGECCFWPVVLWERRMGLFIARGNGLSLSLLSHLTNQPLLEVYPSSLLAAIQMWRRGQDLGRSDTQPQHGVNKRQLLRREWCRELLDKVFRTQRRLLAHTSAKETFSHVLAVLKGDFRTLGNVDTVSIWYILYNIQTDTNMFKSALWERSNRSPLKTRKNTWHVYRNRNKHHIIEQP